MKTNPSNATDQRPQPSTDFEIAKIVQWLKTNGYSMHVTLSGAVTLRKKLAPAPSDGSS